MERWVGRVALVTGASSGIGAALSRALARQGLKVIGCARAAERIQKIADEELSLGCTGSIRAIRCDLTKEADILRMFQDIRGNEGRIDVCVNNAGLRLNSSLLDGSTEQWRNMLDVNVLALCICTRESVKLMKEKNIDDGQIININSMAGHRANAPTNPVYAGTKFMVRALTEGLRRELRAESSQIRVASVSPGVVETEFHYRTFSECPEKAKALYSSAECLKPEDIAQSILYILSTPARVDVFDILVQPTGWRD